MTRTVSRACGLNEAGVKSGRTLRCFGITSQSDLRTSDPATWDRGLGTQRARMSWADNDSRLTSRYRMSRVTLGAKPIAVIGEPPSVPGHKRLMRRREEEQPPLSKLAELAIAVGI